MGGTWGCPEGQKFTFKNMVMWHIKLTGMMSRTECKYLYLYLYSAGPVTALNAPERESVYMFQN